MVEKKLFTAWNSSVAHRVFIFMHLTRHASLPSRSISTVSAAARVAGPLRLRWTVSKVKHIGGLHVGAALAGTAWLCAFTVLAAVPRASRPATVDLTTFVLAMSLATLMIGVVLGAIPPVNARVHGISRSPLREWHTFATVTTPGRSGFRLLISRAGDWASRFIDDPPSHLRVRGVPTRAPMAAIEAMYRRVLCVVTGSGIGPALGQILSARVPGQLVWSTRNTGASYGGALVDELLTAHPDSIVWDATERGKPDLLRLAHDSCREFAAEAVLVVSNKAGTWSVVDGLERLGTPAFEPISDS
jgi:hypothetical protein